jgi:TolA-binding protein
MNNFTLAVFFAVTVPLFLYSAEPSAFGAGDLSNPQPYGLTSNEKVILETKKQLQNVQVKSNNQENKVDSLRERLDGLQSIIESLSRKAHNNKIALEQLNNENQQNSESADEYEKRLTTVIQENTQNIEKLNLVIPEISKLVDTINANYVTKDEFNTLVKDVNDFKALIAKELGKKTKKSSKKAKLSSMSSAEIAKEAQAYFNKKYYTDAIKYYNYLIEKNYKPAYAHYMIGEMNYKRKNYAIAISYFKKSASMYKKASYMPNLMLHTAISMKKTGDTKNANTFFNAVISKYPESKEASEAQKYLN